MTVEELNIKLTADINDLRSQMNRANAQIRSFENTSVNASASALNGFKALKKGLATLGIGKIIKDSLNIAGDLEQGIGGAESVFENYAVAIDKYAKKAYSSMGLAEHEYLATANKMGALFQGSGFSAAKSADMTTKAMQRAADVASIMGISTADAMNAVAGAAKGNFTMMDNLGVAMNDTALQAYAAEKGLGKLETTQQKVNAAMSMFIEKTEYAAGNYAKENDTYAGSLSTLSAELKNFMAEAGTALMPVAQGAIQTVSGIVTSVKPLVLGVASAIGTVGKAFNALTGPQKNTLVLALGLCVAIPVLVKAKHALGSAISFVSTKQFGLTSLMKGGLVTIGLVIAALTLLKGHNQAVAEEEENVGDAMQNSAENAAKGVDKMTDSLKDAKKAVGGLAGFDEITKLSGGSSGALTDGLIGEGFDAELAELSAGMDDLGLGAESLTDTFGGLGDMFGIDLESFKGFWGGVLGKLTSGDWSGALNDIWNGFDNLMENVFGSGWTELRDYWAGVKEIADKEGVLPALGKVCGDIDTLFTQLWGDSWTDFSQFWQDIGAKIASGDWESAMNDLGHGFENAMSDMCNSIDRIFGTHFSDWNDWATNLFHNIGAGIYNILHAEEIGKIQSEADFQKMYGEGAVGTVNDAIVNYLKQGYSPEEAVNAVMNNTDDAKLMAAWKAASNADGYSLSRFYDDADRWYQNLTDNGKFVETPQGNYEYIADTEPTGYQTAEYYRNQGRASETRVDTSAVSTPVSAEDMVDLAAAWRSGASDDRPVQIDITLEADGEAIGNVSAAYRNGQVTTSNGLY